MAGGSLLALAEAWAGSGQVGIADELQAALTKAAVADKQSREVREAALKAFKAVQQRLAAPGADAAAIQQLAGVGRASLAALAAPSLTSTPAAAAQLAGWRYNFARRLVSARAYTAAHAEARTLFRQLGMQQGAATPGKQAAATKAPPSDVEAANLMVGTVLTLLLSCVEGRLLDSADAVSDMLLAAESLPQWLSQLGTEEACRHSEAAYKYLYKAGVMLLEQKAWQQAVGVCGALLAAAGSDVAGQRRALAAATKLAAHMPEEHGAAAVAALAAQAGSAGAEQLSAGVAADLLGMLCSAAQRTTSSAAARVLQHAALSCAASDVLALQTAPLLLPALVLHMPASSGSTEPDWLGQVAAAIQVVSATIQQLQVQGGPQLPLSEAQQHLAVLEAACLSANVLRRTLAGKLAGSAKGAAAGASSSEGDICRLLGGTAAANLAAQVLELLAGAVGVASRQPGGRDTSSSLCAQGHAAAVGLVTAARLRAACSMQQQGGAAGEAEVAGQLGSRQAATWLLGWDLHHYCSDSAELPPAACAVEPQELSWLASALFNVGVDLHANQHYTAAVPILQAALAAAAVGVWALAEGGEPEQEDDAARLSDFCRKCVALSDTQRRAGDASGALSSLGHSLALLLQLGFTELAAWQPLVHAFVRLQADLLHEQTAAPDSSAGPPAAQPARRGRGTASKKPAAATAAAASDAPASSSQVAAADLLLVSLLQQHEAELPGGSVASVVEQELLCWGAATDRSSSLATPAAGDANGVACRHLVSRLLKEVYPAAQQPEEHAGVLLVLHQAGLPAEDGLAGVPLLERAAAVLKKVPGMDASTILARAHCLLALESGRQLAQQELLEQQQERQRSHAAASTSAAGSKEQDAAALGQLADSAQASASAWQRVAVQAGLAVKALQAARGRTGGSSSLTEWGELSWLLGLHGMDSAAQQLHQLVPDVTQPEGSVLAGCLFPAASASVVELQQQAEAAAAESSRASTGVAVQRAVLHRQAAEACAAEGDMVPALYHAAEAHRLLAVLFHGNVDGRAAQPDACSAAPLGWWRLAAAYLGSLLQLGQLFELAGQADEALHALREGQRLAVATGSASMAAVLSARLADIYCKQGELAAAEQAASSAEQQLLAMHDSCDSLALAYCQAAVQLVRAQLSVAAACGSPGKRAWQGCLAVVSTCQELADAARAEEAAAGAVGWCSALHATALLTAAEAALQREDAATALDHATAALTAAKAGGACSALRCQQAAALLFLGQHAAPHTADSQLQHPTVWGLGGSTGGSSAAAAEAMPAAKGRARRAPARQPASRARGRSRAAAPEEDDVATESAAAGQSDSGVAATTAMQQQHVRHLWQALALSRGLLPVHRSVAALLAAECGRLGFLHLASWLLHASLGAAMRLQYQLVLFSRRQQLAQRQRRVGTAGGASADSLQAQSEAVDRLAEVLESSLDWSAVLQLGAEDSSSASSSTSSEVVAPPAARRRRAAGTAASKAAPTSRALAVDPLAALAALEQQAAQQLRVWQESLPGATATCSISALPGAHGGSILISRMAPAGSSNSCGTPPLPPLLVSVPVQQLSASLSQHPIRALRLDDDAAGEDSCDSATSSVQSVLDEMAAVLAESGHSMRELSTETKEQQREWWRARVSLDDRLAALTKHLDSSWLGPWRCLLLGVPPGSAECGAAAAAQYIGNLLRQAGQPASQQQAGVLRHVAAVLAHHAGSLGPGELRQAAHQLCQAAGLACTQEQQHELAALLLAGPASAAASNAEGQQAAVNDMRSDVPEHVTAAGKPKRPGKSVKFADACDSEDAQQQQQQQGEGQSSVAAASAGAQPTADASSSRASRGRRAATARGRRGGAPTVAAAESEQDVVSSSCPPPDGDASPVATLSAVGSNTEAAQEEPPPTTAARGAGLCQVFDSLSLDDPAAPATAAASAAPATGTVRGGGTTTARAGKHRSRLRMLQSGTPGAATARKLLAAAAAAAGAATAPRPARELPLTVAKTAPPLVSRPSSSEGMEAAAAAASPVLLVLDGALQALPWESAPGLLRQRVYRMPSLACAAASALRASTSVDLSSTFYALNPSGDLATTQATFQDWFCGMKGWEGKAGTAPTAAELAAALQQHAFFLYCGHGGGEQYISVTKLRSLQRCSAALLMGCSSGRLRAQQHYEPAGAVLAYLLAGCPAAVANLWDVTDRDIDRFSQAVLTSWISGSSSSAGSSGSESGDGRSEAGNSKSSCSHARDPAACAESAGTDMSAAVGASRGACKLAHLVGAAPVCYGIPAQIFLS